MPYTCIELIEKIIEMSELIGNLKVSLQIETARLKEIRDARKPTDQVDSWEDFTENNLKGALSLAQQNLKEYKRDLISMTRR